MGRSCTTRGGITFFHDTERYVNNLNIYNRSKNGTNLWDDQIFLPETNTFSVVYARYGWQKLKSVKTNYSVRRSFLQIAISVSFDDIHDDYIIEQFAISNEILSSSKNVAQTNITYQEYSYLYINIKECRIRWLSFVRSLTWATKGTRRGDISVRTCVVLGVVGSPHISFEAGLPLPYTSCLHARTPV